MSISAQKMEDGFSDPSMPLNVPIRVYFNKVKLLRTHPTVADRLAAIMKINA